MTATTPNHHITPALTLIDLPRDWRILGTQGTGPQWSGSSWPPDLREIVKFTVGSWKGHEGVVVGYWVDGPEGDRHLGVRLLMSSRPAWHVRELPHRLVCCFVGAEVQPTGVVAETQTTSVSERLRKAPMAMRLNRKARVTLTVKAVVSRDAHEIEALLSGVLVENETLRKFGVEVKQVSVGFFSVEADDG